MDEAAPIHRRTSIPPSASVAYRLPIVASVAGAQALAGFGVNHDALAVSPKMLNVQLVSPGTQNIHCIGREAVFDDNLIGKPLMMKPGRVDGFLDVERENDDADEDCGGGGDDGGAAGRAESQEELAVFEPILSEDDGWRHCRERAFAWVYLIGGALDESIGVRDALFGGEVVHFVVEQEAHAFGGDTGYEKVVERGGNGDGVSFGIDYGIVRGVLRFANGCEIRLGYSFQFAEGRAFQIFAHAGMVEINGVAPCGSVLLVDELRDRNFGEIGIAHKVGAIVESASERFDFEVDAAGGAVAELSEVEAFEDIENFDERDSAGRWRRGADDVVAAIGAPNGLAFLDFVGSEVGGRDEASAFVDGRSQLAGHSAMVEVIGIFGDAFQCTSEFRLLK